MWLRSVKRPPIQWSNWDGSACSYPTTHETLCLLRHTGMVISLSNSALSPSVIAIQLCAVSLRKLGAQFQCCPPQQYCYKFSMMKSVCATLIISYTYLGSLSHLTLAHPSCVVMVDGSNQEHAMDMEEFSVQDPLRATELCWRQGTCLESLCKMMV